MSKNMIVVCSSLLKEHFGEIVEKVATFLIRYGSRPLRVIQMETKLSLAKVKQALCVLIQHNMAEFELNKRGIVEYSVNVENVFLLHRYPQYIYCSKTLYGDVGELLIEELLNNGQMTMDAVIKKVTERLTEAIGEDKSAVSESSVKEKFHSLVQSHFVLRCATAKWEDSNSPIPKMVLQQSDMFKIPDIGNVNESDDDFPPTKKQKMSSSTESLIYWHVNVDRIHQYFRDQAIIKAVAAKVDVKAGEVVRALLRLAETRTDPWAISTNPVPRHELWQALKNQTNVEETEMDSYLSLLTEDSMALISKMDERGGGMYSVNIQKVLQKLAEAIAISVVQDKYGSKSCRIFRLLLLKKYLEQKQIEEMAMVHTKDAKTYTYKMVHDNFIAIHEIAKTPDHAASRAYFLFHVNLNQNLTSKEGITSPVEGITSPVVGSSSQFILACKNASQYFNKLGRTLLDQCYKVLFNSICRREYETKENKRLLDKKQRVEAIIATLQQSGADETQIQEVEDMISPPENAQLEKVKHITNKLENSEIQIDETILILTEWLKSLEKAK